MSNSITGETSILELLKRLEVKGVPLSVETVNQKWEPSALRVKSVEGHAPHMFYFIHNGVINSKWQWLIIGCVVEYMEAQGYYFEMCQTCEGFCEAVFFDTHVYKADSSTLLEAVLVAADRVLS